MSPFYSGGALVGRHAQHTVEIKVELHDDRVAGGNRGQSLHQEVADVSKLQLQKVLG